MARPALGVIETKGLAGAIQATHAATKAAGVAIASAEKTDAGHIAVKIEGDWAAVQAAVEAGARAADEAGELVSMHVIPRSDDTVSPILPYRRFIDRYRPGGPASEPSIETRPRPKPPKPPRPHPAAVDPVASKPPAPQPTFTPPPPIPEPPPPAPSVSPDRPPQTGEVTWAELRAMSVVNLRKYARSVTNLPIQGRQISIANKQQLLDAIEAAMGRKQV